MPLMLPLYSGLRRMLSIIISCVRALVYVSQHGSSSNVPASDMKENLSVFSPSCISIAEKSIESR